ncbi:MAG: tetratricopeptide repeat protein [Cyanobacteria bacterium P01_F01_bin.150]
MAIADPNKTLQALRAALAISPDNLPLHQHLAETLLRLGYGEEAERGYRQALAQEPDHPALKL